MIDVAILDAFKYNRDDPAMHHAVAYEHLAELIRDLVHLKSHLLQIEISERFTKATFHLEQLIIKYKETLYANYVSTIFVFANIVKPPP
jgi:hypothetical protein